MKPVRDWVLHDIPHLVGTFAALVALLVGVAVVRHHGGAHHTRPVAAPAVVTPTRPSTSSTSLPVPTTRRAAAVPPVTTTTVSLPPTLPAAAARVGVEFVTAWADTTVPAAVWHARVEALCVPQLAAELASTDVANVPAGVKITGRPSGSGDAGGGSMSIPTNKRPIDVIVALYRGHYRVSSFDTTF